MSADQRAIHRRQSSLSTDSRRRFAFVTVGVLNRGSLAGSSDLRYESYPTNLSERNSCCFGFEANTH